MRRLLLASVVLAAVAAPASAKAQLTEISPACEIAVFSPTFTQCGGAFAGNDNTVDVMTYITNTFGLTDVVNAGKSDDGGSGPFTSNPGGSTGTLTFDQPINGNFVLSLKAGSNFSLYYFAGVTNLTAIDFSTTGINEPNNGGNVNGLSHATLFIGDETFIGQCLPGAAGCQTTVPEPSTYVLMGTGLLALGFASRRRRKA